MFQALFGTRGSEKILGGFLSSILGEKVENVSLEANQNVTAENKEQKRGILDLRANVGDNTTVNIEVQMTDPKNMFKRLLWYWARIYGIQLKNTENYSKLKKTIAILIANYDIDKLESFQDSHTEWNLIEKRNLNINMFEDIEIHIIELPKILKSPNATDKNLRAWLEFLINPESEVVKMCMKENSDLNEAYEKLEYISEDEDLRRMADLRLMAILDENSKREAREQQEERIRIDQESLIKGQESLKKGQESLKKGQESLKKGQESLKKGQESLKKGQESLKKGQESLKKGQDSLKKGKESLKKERESLKRTEEELEKGQEELEKAKEEFALNLIKANVDIEQISKITKLSIEQIKGLNNK